MDKADWIPVERVIVPPGHVLKAFVTPSDDDPPADDLVAGLSDWLASDKHGVCLLPPGSTVKVVAVPKRGVVFAAATPPPTVTASPWDGPIEHWVAAPRDLLDADTPTVVQGV